MLHLFLDNVSFGPDEYNNLQHCQFFYIWKMCSCGSHEVKSLKSLFSAKTSSTSGQQIVIIKKIQFKHFELFCVNICWKI